MSEYSVIGALRHRIRGWETRRDTDEELRVTILRQWDSLSLPLFLSIDRKLLTVRLEVQCFKPHRASCFP